MTTSTNREQASKGLCIVKQLEVRPSCSSDRLDCPNCSQNDQGSPGERLSWLVLAHGWGVYPELYP
ncbi:hypothetical protein BD779DRAFT_1117877 [Infundibulicybe gibba]|nr:hypothetical protein BD779DRAFT_1117877 [Infundibulicybe gibba]